MGKIIGSFGLLLCYLFLFILLNLKFEIFPKVLCRVKMDLHCISVAKYSILEQIFGGRGLKMEDVFNDTSVK